ncbi:MAG: glycosyltransferase [Salinivirgaceae bacterium]|nr:glycosyltransferase [Salinivirgaceae bacterium]MDD4745686.1 glycosyltransferase [Salinivirgaceae bacterium]MDY0279650.1 glycosyltransferase [Salinivirgaceae bacterium]
MTKVLRIINRFNLGGPTYNAGYLTKHLSSNFETRLIGGPNEESETDSLFILESIGVEGEIIEEMRRSIHPLNDWRAFLKLRKIIKEYRPDIVHTHASKAGTLGRLAALCTGVKVIVHTYHGHVFHSYFSPIKTFIFKTIERFLAKRSSAIIVISELQKMELCHQFKIVQEKKAHVIPLGFDLSRFSTPNPDLRTAFRAEYSIRQDEILVVIVGRMAPIKNHAMFIRVASHTLQHIGNKLRFMIVGDGETRAEIEELAITNNMTISTPEKLNPQAQIIFTSWILDVERVYSGADISVLTSLNEGTPVSLIESIASGVPVISTEVGGIADFVTDGIHGYLTKVNDDLLFAAKLLELANNQQLRSKLAANGQEKILKIFDYRRLVTDVEKLYTKLLSE